MALVIKCETIDKISQQSENIYYINIILFFTLHSQTFATSSVCDFNLLSLYTHALSMLKISYLMFRVFLSTVFIPIWRVRLKYSTLLLRCCISTAHGEEWNEYTFKKYICYQTQERVFQKRHIKSEKCC